MPPSKGPMHEDPCEDSVRDPPSAIKCVLRAGVTQLAECLLPKRSVTRRANPPKCPKANAAISRGRPTATRSLAPHTHGRMMTPGTGFSGGREGTVRLTQPPSLSLANRTPVAPWASALWNDRALARAAMRPWATKASPLAAHRSCVRRAASAPRDVLAPVWAIHSRLRPNGGPAVGAALRREVGA
jgi:hypothetical protein